MRGAELGCICLRLLLSRCLYNCTLYGVAPSWDVYAYYIYTSAAVLQSTTRNMNCDRAVIDKLPNTAFLDTIIGMQNGTIPSMFVGATVFTHNVRYETQRKV